MTGRSHEETIMRSVDGLSLEFSDRRPVPATVEEINAELRKIGAGVWPLDLRGQPAEFRDLLKKPKLDDTESERLKTHFLLPMDGLLEIIGKAGRSPHVSGGGAMETWVTNQDYGYPQLYQVEAGIDYSRFDRLHVNVSADGVGVDEVFQMLSGSGFVIRQRLDDGEMLTLTLDSAPGRGWVGTYSGTRPHIGSVSSASPGSKLLVQVIGAPRWIMRYVDPDT
jgi:hypothetical protein